MSALGTFFGMANPLIMAEFLSRTIPGMNDAMQEAGDEIVALATKETQDRLFPGHGYDTGRLHDSYQGTASSVGTTAVEINFGTDVEYAAYLEYRWGGRFSHFEPAMQVVEQEIPEIVKKHVNGKLGI
jgi:hypothetical protein